MTVHNSKGEELEPISREAVIALMDQALIPKAITAFLAAGYNKETTGWNTYLQFYKRIHKQYRLEDFPVSHDWKGDLFIVKTVSASLKAKALLNYQKIEAGAVASAPIPVTPPGTQVQAVREAIDINTLLHGSWDPATDTDR